MSTTDVSAAPRGTDAASGGPLGVTQLRTIVSEWVKFRSLRSTWWSIGVTLLASVGLGLLLAYLRGRDMRIHDYYEPDQTLLTLHGFFLAQLPVGVLGAMFVTGEYSTGMIRATLAATPRRTPVWVAKAAVFAAVIFLTCLVASFVTFFGGQAILHHYSVQGVWQTVNGHRLFATCAFKGPIGVPAPDGPHCLAGMHGALRQLGVSLGSPGALRAVFGAALYMVGIGLLGMGCGWAIRNTGAAIATLFGLVLVLPLLAEALPTSLQQDISKYLPLDAGTAIMNTVTDPGSSTLAPWAGIGVFAIYMVAAMAVGLAVLHRRDA